MRIRAAHMILILTFASLQSCIDDYWPVLDKYEDLLVVDGMISNEPGPYTIRLSRSTGLTDPLYLPLEGATVVIRELSGEEEMLSEKEAGTFVTSTDGIKGKVGNSYRIEIETAQGHKYTSPFRRLKEPVGIDSVYALVEYEPQGNNLQDLGGYRFYIDTEPAPRDTNYLLWDLWATYKYNADFKIRYYFEGTLKPFPRSDSLKTCWRTYKVEKIFTAETGALASSVIKKYPLNFVSTNTKELSIRYSLLVNQWTLGSHDYEFWNQVKKQNEEQGGLYASQPFQIRGNIRNENDPDEPVLGNFTVAGISQKRIFVNRPGFLVMHYFVCELSDGDFENMATLHLYPPESWPVYVTSGLNGALALPNQECMDCRLSGGTIIKPDFWTDY